MRLTFLFAACTVLLAVAACASGRMPAARGIIEPELADVAFAARAYDVIKRNCWGCHGQPGKQTYGEITPLDWILDYDKLISNTLVIPGSAAKSRLIYITAVLGKMPRKFNEQGVPSIEGKLGDEDQQTLIDWVKSGAPRWR